jgi:polyisoprenoid-binding protein YceI
MAKLGGRPSKRLVVLAIGGGVALVVIAFLLIYFVIFPTSSPEPFKANSATGGTASGATSSTARASSPTGLAGRWKLSSGSQAGYRVREKLAFLPAQSDAVGRTSQITGSATFNHSKGALTITAASFAVAVNTLTSDRSMRDEKIHEIGLESNRYPTATFVLSTPLTVPPSVLKGKVASVSVTGTFDIHGVAKRATLPVEMVLSGSTFEAVGSLTFPWSEFGMTAPSIGGFVNVTEKATMEFDLHLQRA